MRNVFSEIRFLVPICEKLTGHKHRRFIGCTKKFIDSGYKYPNRNDFYYKCKICGCVFFTHKISKEDIEKIKQWEKEKEC